MSNMPFKASLTAASRVSYGANESVIKAVADAFVARGLAKAGYEYINLDCGYSTGFRDGNGNLQVGRSDTACSTVVLHHASMQRSTRPSTLPGSRR